ncbi:beta-galactosidase 11-like [Musa acuminata AAA Group]|uniref:beta-galactosidase 11-like n=1 Tax=Musa acuminata AAA Group TaxID=214697 RepID=UPI0031DE226F
MVVSPETIARSSIRTLFLLTLLVSDVAGRRGGTSQGVTYDRRSLILNGRRELLFSGSVHYPRSTPEMWPEIIASAKHGGLNVIQTYVFWNLHEPVQGQYNFQGKYDVVRFIKLIEKKGMYATLRIGPYIEAEWNYGGFPYWLKEVQNISFRTDNPPFKYHMKRFVEKVVSLMKDEKLFASQGGPIILSQVENEYNNVAHAYKDAGLRYVRWAGNMAVDLKTGVPWVMCKEKSAPGPVINACNGRNCGDTFEVPNNSTKPFLWTENWTAQYRVFGDPPSQRSAEDLAYSVARFFSKNGTLVNYYMYHGGTNFGRSGSSFAMTRYYDEAPLDEFGLHKEPKYGHLSHLHHALRLCSKALLWGVSSVQTFDIDGFEATVYENPGMKACAAFLSNSNRKIEGTVNFKGTDYYLPRRSISILPDCKTVAFNTQKVISQHNARTFHVAKESSMNNQWQMHKDHIPRFRDTRVRSRSTLELFNMTKDTSDYLWYTTSFRLEDDDLPRRHDIRPVLLVSNLGHAMHAFVNGRHAGSGHGTNIEKSFVFHQPIALGAGINHVTILCMTIGLPNSGSYLEHRIAGVHTVVIQGLNTGTLDLSQNGWGHQVGLVGEKLGIFNEKGVNNVNWTQAQNDMPITWYKRYFDAPSGNDPVALDLTSMSKGMVWINGESIGRYWVSYLNPLQKPSQSVYHVPRSLLKPKDNLMVVFEEHRGKPEGIVMMTVKRDNICTFVSELFPGQASSSLRESSKLGTVAHPEARLKCTGKKVIHSIAFASFGNPEGLCGNYSRGSCHAPQTKAVVEKACLGKKNCALSMSYEAYGADINCVGTTGTLAVHAKCALGSALQVTSAIG